MHMFYDEISMSRRPRTDTAARKQRFRAAVLMLFYTLRYRSITTADTTYIPAE